MPVTSNASGIKAGTVAYFAASTAPAGWLKCNGATVSRATYAALFNAIGTTYGAGDGSTTFAIPDLRGEFVRGLDDGRGVDSGRGIGTAQNDALQNMTGSVGRSLSAGQGLTNDGGTGVFANGTLRANGIVSSVGTGLSDISFDASRVARTASETRPRNVAMLACIKF